MSQTHLSLHYHIIFSAKERRASIGDDWRNRLHAFMGGCVKTLGGIPEAVGGTKDHVHLLIGLRATHRLADAVKEIKVASSKWIHQELDHKLFSWQSGYAAFTVSVSQIENVKNYVLNQEEHHRNKNFEEEYIEIFKTGECRLRRTVSVVMHEDRSAPRTMEIFEIRFAPKAQRQFEINPRRRRDGN